MKPGRAHWASWWAAALAGLFAVATLVGWRLRIEILTTVLPGRAPMMPLTAWLLLLLSLALGLRATDRVYPVQRALHVMALALAVWVLVAYVAGWEEIASDRLWLAEEQLAVDPLAGRTSPRSAVTAILLAAAGLLVAGRGGRGVGWAQVLASLAGVFAYTAIVGHVYQVVLLYGLRPYIGMAIHTALAFLALAFGFLLVVPDRGLTAQILRPGTGGVFLRRLLTAAVLLPLVVGALIQALVVGGLVGQGFGASLYVLSLTALLAALVARTAAVVDSLEDRRLAEAAARARAEAFREQQEPSTPTGSAGSRTTCTAPGSRGRRRRPWACRSRRRWPPRSGRGSVLGSAARCRGSGWCSTTCSTAPRGSTSSCSSRSCRTSAVGG